MITGLFLKRKKDIHRHYVDAVDTIEGLAIVSVSDYAENNHWMNLLQIDSEIYGEDREALMHRLEENGIQTRPIWFLNHLQKPYWDCQSYKNEKAEELVKTSLCLPSSTNLKDDDLNNVITQLNG